jgi:coenzyme Q-binding protein COQ10
VLEVGWGGVRERFTSRIYCVPGRVVEAVGGQTGTTLRREEIGHHFRNEDSSGSAGGRMDGKMRERSTEEGILTHLLTRWTVTPLEERSTRVGLVIEFQFANPVYAAMSSAVAGRVADVMIEAFEKRVETELEQEAGETRLLMEEPLKGV